MKEAAQDVKTKAGDLVRTIDSSLSSISSAQAATTFDLISPNPASAIMSYSSTTSASSDISRVRSVLSDFKRALDDFDSRKAAAANLSFNSHVDGTLAYIMDVTQATNGSNFADITNIFNLSSARSDLERLKRNIQDIDRSMDKVLDELRRNPSLKI